MRQLSCTGPGVLEWQEVDEPALPGADGALIRPIAVARCDLDPLLITGGPTTTDRFAVGHEAIGEVLAVGAAVDAVRPGDIVACAFQLSCGRCPTCARGHTALCEQYPILSDYGMQTLSGVEYGGMVADVVPIAHATAMLVPVPPSVDPIRIASAGDNVADGYRAVAPHLAARPHADVLVVCHGGRSIALYATLAALVLGAGSVTFESDDEEARAVATSLGARATPTDYGKRAGRWPIVVDCGIRVDGLIHAAESTEPEGVLQSVGYYSDALTPLPLGKLYTRGIRFYTGRAHSAATLPEVMNLIARGLLDPGAVTPTVISWGDAPTRYLDDAVKLVVAR
jgi:alcohol dehydrogenase